MQRVAADVLMSVIDLEMHPKSGGLQEGYGVPAQRGRGSDVWMQGMWGLACDSFSFAAL